MAGGAGTGGAGGAAGNVKATLGLLGGTTTLLVVVPNGGKAWRSGGEGAPVDLGAGGVANCPVTALQYWVLLIEGPSCWMGSSLGSGRRRVAELGLSSLTLSSTCPSLLIHYA